MRIAACGQEMVLGGCFGFGGCAISLRSIRTAFGAISLRSIRLASELSASPIRPLVPGYVLAAIPGGCAHTLGEC